MAQAQYEHTCSCIILKIAVNITDLGGNSGNRFEKINTRRKIQQNTFYLIYLVSSCFLCQRIGKITTQEARRHQVNKVKSIFMKIAGVFIFSNLVREFPKNPLC